MTARAARIEATGGNKQQPRISARREFKPKRGWPKLPATPGRSGRHAARRRRRSGSKQASPSTSSRRPPTPDRTNALPSNAPHLDIHATIVRWVTAVLAIITSLRTAWKTLVQNTVLLRSSASAEYWVTGVRGVRGQALPFARVRGELSIDVARQRGVIHS